MSFVAPTWGQVLLLPLVLGCFLLPGWLMARRWPTPAPLVTAFLGSATLLFLLVLALEAVGVPLQVRTLGLGFAAASAALLWRWPLGTPRFARDPARPTRHGAAWWWWLPVAGAAISLVLRAVMDPQCGFDATFRWDYLARLFLTHQSLAGYPPLTAADFEYYSWCDGIPPLIPLLNLWIYAGTGTIAPVLTGARVVGEAWLLGLVVFRYARLLWGDAGGLPAVAALASSALALWSLQIAQETGVLAISLVAMLHLLELHAREDRLSLTIWAAVAAAIGALSREYGLAYPLLGFGLLLMRRQGRAALWFALVAAAVCAPWYVRNWVLTGNPLYPQTLGGLFPGNAVHDEQMQYFRDFWSLRTGPSSPLIIPQFLAVLAGAVVLTGLVGLGRLRSRALPPALGIGLVGAIWFFLNLPQSGGGWVYASRVLLPGLALLAVLSGWLGTVQRRPQVVLVVLLTLVSGDAARRSWMLPVDPFTPALSLSFASWRTMHDFATRTAPYRLWTDLTRRAGGGGIVVDHPAHHSILTLCGGRAVPLVSPVLAPAFDEQQPFEAVVAGLRRAGIRYVTITPANPVTAQFVKRHRFWRELGRRNPSGAFELVAIYDLDRVLLP